MGVLTRAIAFLVPFIGDSFDRADGGLGANWTTQSAYSAPQIVSNTVQSPTDTAFYGAVWSAITFTDDQFSECDSTLGTAYSEVDLWVRADTTGNNGYAFVHQTDTGGSLKLYKIVAGVLTQLGSSLTGQGTTGTLKLSVVGTTVKAYLNGVEVFSTTDSDIASGQPGIYIHRSGGTTATIDNFSAGNL